MLDHIWTTKPACGWPLRRGGLAQGLMGFYALSEGAGGTIYDATGRLALAAAGFGSTSPWGSGPSGGGVLCNMGAGVGAGFTATLPASLQVVWPVTIGVGMRRVGTPDGHSQLWGALANNGNAGPFTCWELSADGTNLNLNYNSAGTFTSLLASGYTIPLNQDIVHSATITGASQTVYAAGAQVAATATAISNPQYAATACLPLGYYTGQTNRTSATLFYWAAWWNRALSPAEHAAIGASPRAIFGQLFMPPLGTYLLGQVGPGPTFMPWIFGDQIEANGLG